MTSAKLIERLKLTKILPGLTVVLAASLLSGGALGNDRETIPPDPYAPIYMDWYGDDARVAFIFYRPADCVPLDFNLYAFFDIPDAFSCTPLTIEGFVVYKDDGVPRHAQLKDAGEVPVWFISQEDYDAITADGDLLFSEVLDSESLIQGYATSYTETRHIEGGHPAPKVNITASGWLDEGSGLESFWFHVFWKMGGNVNVNIRLE